MMQGIVFDMGSMNFRAGFSGNEIPSCDFHSILGKYNIKKGGYWDPGSEGFKVHVGGAASIRTSTHDILHPISIDRTPIDINELYHFFDFANYFLRLSPDEIEETPHMITSYHHIQKKNYRDFAEMFFERMYVPALSVVDSSVMNMFNSGSTTGLSFECGHGITQATPIFEGLPIHYAKTVLMDSSIPPPRKLLSGSLLTDFLFDHLPEKVKLDRNEYKEREIVREMKEKVCYVKLNEFVESKSESESESIGSLPDENKKSTGKVEYTLPDGMILELGSEIFQIPEILFKPQISIGYSKLPGIHKLIQVSIQKTSPDLHEILYKNIVISGGTTLLKNFKERLFRELVRIAPYSVKVNRGSLETETNERRIHSTWIGGIILSSLPFFKDYWVTRDEYDDVGDIRIKCQLTSTLASDCDGGKDSNLFESVRELVDGDLIERKNYLIQDYICESTQFRIMIIGNKKIVSVMFKSLFLK